MIIISWIIIGFAVLQLIISLINLIFRPSFSKAQIDDVKVSVLIPARNEEKNIQNILLDIQHQTHKNTEIIVFDDLSTDNTADLVLQMGKYDRRIQLITSTELPDGWLGKNYACHTLAGKATGQYLLFLDADVRIDEDMIKKTVTHIQKTKSKLVSVFPKQIMINPGEKAVVPVMNYILLTLLPLILVRYSGFSSLSAANGQCMLFDAETYKNLMPHEQLRAEKVEDIRIARLFKKRKFKISCVAANNDIKCRMYCDYNESINGFSKNIVMFFGNSYVLATLFWLFTTFGFIIVLISLPIKWFILLNVITIIVRVFVSLTSGQKITTNLLYLIPQQLNTGYIIFKSFINKINGRYEWRGRIIQ